MWNAAKFGDDCLAEAVRMSNSKNLFFVMCMNPYDSYGVFNIPQSITSTFFLAMTCSDEEIIRRLKARLGAQMGVNMELRKYKKEDSATICSWIKDEKSLYQWSANRIGKFPLTDNDLNEDYAPMMKGNRFIPLSAFDDDGNLVGHLYIRYSNETDDSIVRFGFVIVDPVLRGCGNGKEMLRLAINYTKNTLYASKITLGVFANNDSARYCYKSVGFQPVGKTEIYKMPIGEWECIEMELKLGGAEKNLTHQDLKGEETYA